MKWISSLKKIKSLPKLPQDEIETFKKYYETTLINNINIMINIVLQ